METTVTAKVSGVVDKIYVSDGDEVNQDDLLVSFVVDEKDMPERVHPELPKMDLATLDQDEFKSFDLKEMVTEEKRGLK